MLIADMFLIDTGSSITCVLRKEKALAMITISLQMHFNIIRNQSGIAQRGTTREHTSKRNKVSKIYCRN